ncbi:OLC1v1024550C1 [Oldenlandia corymbosa var. corymbosa]|uniref:OLC1v1024550C1 n=1 Tax=Oldenlandia corymbosa var. corymbosa TaxID=529605 RepID=A0AAV1C2M7_OLDCO|nr:OLC1v1024550C1 [Oldenlandia corymbosa var. corymbosa]
MAVMMNEMTKLRSELSKSKAEVCVLCDGSHSLDDCPSKMEAVQFVRQRNAGGFNNFNNWRNQQQTNWNNAPQQGNYQRLAQPPGFNRQDGQLPNYQNQQRSNQQYIPREDEWISVQIAIKGLVVSCKSLENQLAQIAKHNAERPSGSLPSDTIVNPKGNDQKQAKAVTLRSGKQLNQPSEEATPASDPAGKNETSFEQISDNDDMVEQEQPAEKPGMEGIQFPAPIKEPQQPAPTPPYPPVDAARQLLDNMTTNHSRWQSDPRAISKQPGMMEFDPSTHLQAQMAVMMNEMTKLRSDLSKSKAEVCVLCDGSHSLDDCPSKMEAVQFVRQRNAGGFNNFNNWRNQQQTNWNNAPQQENYQRPAQPPGFHRKDGQLPNYQNQQRSNQQYIPWEDEWISVQNAIKSLAVSCKSLENQLAQIAKQNVERPSGSLPSDTIVNPKGNDQEQAKAVTLRSGKQLNQPSEEVTPASDPAGKNETSFEQISDNDDMVEQEQPAEKPGMKGIQFPAPIKEPQQLAPTPPYPPVDAARQLLDYMTTNHSRWQSDPRVISKQPGVMELDPSTHLQAQMAVMMNEMTKLRSELSKSKAEVCVLCDGSHSLDDCPSKMEAVQFVRQGNAGGFNNFNNWRNQQQTNWNNAPQQGNYQRLAQPPGFNRQDGQLPNYQNQQRSNQQYIPREDEWISVQIAIKGLVEQPAEKPGMEGIQFPAPIKEPQQPAPTPPYPDWTRNFPPQQISKGVTERASGTEGNFQIQSQNPSFNFANTTLRVCHKMPPARRKAAARKTASNTRRRISSSSSSPSPKQQRTPTPPASPAREPTPPPPPQPPRALQEQALNAITDEWEPRLFPRKKGWDFFLKHIRRKFIPERGIGEDGAAFAYIKRHGWETFSKPLIKPRIQIVQEFYGNFHTAPRDGVFVRGISVNCSTEAIRAIWKLPRISIDYRETLAALHPNQPLKQAILSRLAKEGTSWEMDDQENPLGFPANALQTPDLNLWHHFICCNLMPTSYTAKVTYEMALLLAGVTFLHTDAESNLQQPLRMHKLDQKPPGASWPGTNNIHSHFNWTIEAEGFQQAEQVHPGLRPPMPDEDGEIPAGNAQVHWMP